MAVTVPEAFVRATADREGQLGSDWIRTLPAIVGDLLELWACDLDGAVTHGGVALIVPVLLRDGEPAVMKVSFTHPGNVHEPFALEAWNGVGAVRLVERCDAQYAMLLERASTTTLASLPDGDQVMAIAGALSRRLAIPAPPQCPALQTQLSDWRDDLTHGAKEFPGLFDDELVAAAIELIDSSAPSGADVLIHGDLHANNILKSEREGWLAVDPKGYVGDRGFDAGMVVKWMTIRMLEGARPGTFDDAAVSRALDVYSEAAELDRDSARAWAQIHALQGAYWARHQGIRDARRAPGRDPAVHLADHLARSLSHL